MLNGIDSYKYQGLRKALVDELRMRGIKDAKVLAALNKIPRHLFFDKVFHDQFAYADKAFPIGAGQTISQPSTVAFQSEILEIKKGEKVLEIGTGCGYQTAVLVELGAKVYSIERQRELFVKAKLILEEMGYRPNLFFGDGFEGKEAFAPYDKIIVTCGAPFIPEKLVNQLAKNGKMVVPVGEGRDQVMKLIQKDENGEIMLSEHGNFSFVPMLINKQY